MVSKKKKRIILISIISLVLVVAIVIGSIFLIKKDKADEPNTPSAEQVTDTTIQSNTSNKDIAEGNIPQNYNGTYKFSSLSLVWNENLNYQEKQALLSNKGVGDFNALNDMMKQTEIDNFEKNNELLVLQNGNINKTTGKDNPTPIKESAGKYVGNDNLAKVTSIDSNEIYYISLKYDSFNEATLANKESKTDGSVLYLFKKIYSKYDPEVLLLTVTYKYELYVIEPEFDETIYDF